MLTEQEQSKLGARKDRYGVFGAPGASEFDRVVSAERKNMVQLDGLGKPKQAWTASKEDAKQVKSVLDDALKSLGSRVDLRVQDASDKSSATPSEVESEFEDEDMGSDLTEDEGR